MNRFVPVLLAIAVGLPATAYSAPIPWGVRLSFPTSDATTAVSVAWNTPSDQDASVVEFGETSAYGRTVTGTARAMPSPLDAVHEAVLDGLEPGTTYHYRVGGPGGWSDDAVFRTPPADACTPLVFVAMGDDRSDDNSGVSPRWNPILAEAVSHKPHFVLNSGDIVMDGQETKQWWAWLQASEPYLGQVPTAYTIGNHDDGPGEGDGAYYNQIFAQGRNDATNTEDYYFFTAGDAIFVSLSTMTFKGGAIPFADQAAWLDKVLTENPRTWKFVTFHHPMHTSFAEVFKKELAHAPNEQGQNAAFDPVLAKHHVDMVFVGHNHWYERFSPMKNSVPERYFEDGTVHVVTGGAGAMTYGLLNAISLFCPSAPGSRKCSGDHHFVVVTIEGNRLTYVARATQTQFLSSSPDNSKEIDRLVIEKPVPEPNPCVPDVVEPIPDAAIADEGSDTSEDVPGQPDVPKLPDWSTVDTGVAQPDTGVRDSNGSAPDSSQVQSDTGPTDLGPAVPQPTAKGSGCTTGTEASPVPWFLTMVLFGLPVGVRRLRKAAAARRSR
jgi:hypothetical protein